MQGLKWCDAVCWEFQSFDVIGLSGMASIQRDQWAVKRHEYNVKHYGHTGKPPRPHKPRLALVEVKLSKSDLRAGIKRKQFKKYEESKLQPTHMYLAVHRDVINPAEEAWFWGRNRNETLKAGFEMLKELGVPEHWGIVTLGQSRGRDRTLIVEQARQPSACRPDPGLNHRLGVAEKIAASFAYRVLSGDSPMNEPAEEPPQDGAVG